MCGFSPLARVRVVSFGSSLSLEMLLFLHSERSPFPPPSRKLSVFFSFSGAQGKPLLFYTFTTFFSRALFLHCGLSRLLSAYCASLSVQSSRSSSSRCSSLLQLDASHGLGFFPLFLFPRLYGVVLATFVTVKNFPPPKILFFFSLLWQRAPLLCDGLPFFSTAPVMAPSLFRKLFSLSKLIDSEAPTFLSFRSSSFSLPQDNSSSDS